MNASMQDIGSEVGQKGDQLARGASTEVRNLISDVEELIKRVTNVSDDDIARVRAKVERTLADAKTSINERAGRVKEQAGQAVHVTDDYVHDHPWQSVGLAAVLGVAIGLLASRRR